MQEQNNEIRENELAAPAETPEGENEQSVEGRNNPDNIRVEADALKEQLLRKIAEFENYRRRTREEQIQLIKFANEGLILDLLPVLDDFIRSLAYGKEHPDFESFYAGVEIIANKLQKILEQRGLKKMDVLGKRFDVDFHDALLEIPDPNNETGVILNEVETGYLLNDKVLRHAKVTVAVEAPRQKKG
jgi:molecular chaperone GrpE